MLDLCRDPSDTPGVAFAAGGEPAFCASDFLAELASNSLRNCSLFMVAEQSLLCVDARSRTRSKGGGAKTNSMWGTQEMEQASWRWLTRIPGTRLDPGAWEQTPGVLEIIHVNLSRRHIDSLMIYKYFRPCNICKIRAEYQVTELLAR